MVSREGEGEREREGGREGGREGEERGENTRNIPVITNYDLSVIGERWMHVHVRTCMCVCVCLHYTACTAMCAGVSEELSGGGRDGEGEGKGERGEEGEEGERGEEGGPGQSQPMLSLSLLPEEATLSPSYAQMQMMSPDKSE